MSSFEQNIENILVQSSDPTAPYINDPDALNGWVLIHTPTLKQRILQAHQDDLLAVIGEDEQVEPMEQPVTDYWAQRVRRARYRNQLRAEQRTHLTQETGND